jgi:flagellar basal-body rod modification protein FlgD
MSEITNILNSQQNYNKSNDGTGKSELGKDDFLKLMMAQMKYQDPMNPLDSNEYAAQLAQFSQLEQLSNLNENVTRSIDANYLLTQSVNNTMTATLIGKDVKLDSQFATYNGQKNITFGYDLPTEASSVKINIYDQFGSLVRTIDSDKLSEGYSKLSWDFTDNDGNNVAHGAYRFEIEATATNGNPMTVASNIFGTIDGVRYGENGTTLLIDNVEYSLAQIQEIFSSQQGGR